MPKETIKQTDWISILIPVIPEVLWFLFAVILVWIFYAPIKNQLIPKLSRFSGLGIELDFDVVHKSIDAALELAEKSEKWHVEVSEEEKTRVIERAKRHFTIFNGAQILWLDDHPENNVNERRMFRQLHMDVDTATTVEQALSMLNASNYDVILSDMTHDLKPQAGLEFIQRYVENKNPEEITPVIFYIGVTDPSKGTPPFAFGLTHKPNELLHLLLDVLDRKKLHPST